MKKLLLLVLSLILVISVCACGGNEEEIEEDSSSMPDVSAVESATPTPTPPPADVKVCIAGDGVNVREAPNLDCEVYGMAVNEAFYLIEEDDGSGFHKIMYGDKEAYIYAEYCTLQELTEADAQALVEGLVTPEVSNSESEPEEDEPTVSVNSEDGQRR